MKHVALLFILVMCAEVCHGQVMARAHVIRQNQFSVTTSGYGLYQEARPAGLRQRNIGRVMTLAGVALGIGGVAVFSDARRGTVISNGQYTQTPEDNKMTVGILMVEGGVGLFIPGVILWKKGQKKYNRYLEQQSVSFRPRGAGFLIRYSL